MVRRHAPLDKDDIFSAPEMMENLMLEAGRPVREIPVPRHAPPGLFRALRVFLTTPELSENLRAPRRQHPPRTLSLRELRELQPNVSYFYQYR